MADALFKGIGGDDVDDMIFKIEASYGIHFDEHELEHVATFGEFCDIVLAKLPATEATDCTSQQAFYKLRKAVALQVPNAVLTPATSFESFLPRTGKERKQLLRLVGAELGFPLDVVGPSASTTIIIFFAFIVSFAAFFIDWHLGMVGLLLSFTGAYMAGKFGNTFYIETIKEVVEQMARENYKQSRRNPTTINRTEIVKQLQLLFKHEFGFELPALTPGARF